MERDFNVNRDIEGDPRVYGELTDHPLTNKAREMVEPTPPPTLKVDVVPLSEVERENLQEEIVLQLRGINLRGYPTPGGVLIKTPKFRRLSDGELL